MKLKRCVLHLGTEKTGSTSIQSFLEANRERLLRLGYLVPSCFGIPNHMGITVACGSSGNVADLCRHVLRAGEDISGYRKRLAGELADEIRSATEAGATTLLVSNEHLHSRIRTIDEARCVVDLLSQWVERVEGVLYLRRQDRLAVSLHSTRLKVDSGTRAQMFPDDPAGLQYYDYLALAKRWRSALGDGQLRLRRFERVRLAGGDVLKDYLGIVGLPAEPGDWALPKAMNESLSIAAQAFLEAFNQRIPRYVGRKLNPLRGNIVGILEQHFPGDGPAVARGPALDFYGRFRQDNRLLAEEFGFEEGMFDEDFDHYPETPVVPDFDEAVRIACELWLAQRRTILRLERQASARAARRHRAD